MSAFVVVLLLCLPDDRPCLERQLDEVHATIEQCKAAAREASDVAALEFYRNWLERVGPPVPPFAVAGGCRALPTT